MKLNNQWLVIAIFVIVFGGIFIFDSFGMWQTESSKEVTKISEGKFAGEGNPEDIRGSYSFNDINDNFDIDPAILAKAFNIETSDPGSIKAKDLETLYSELGDDMEIGTGAVKQFVASYKGLPYEGEDYILSSTITVLNDAGKWNDELASQFVNLIIEVDELNKVSFDNIVSPDSNSENSQESNLSSESSDHVEEIGIKGKTTVSDAISYGITLEQIEEVLGVEVTNKNMLIRDICEQNGLGFSTVKAELASLLEE